MTDASTAELVATLLTAADAGGDAWRPALAALLARDAEPRLLESLAYAFSELEEPRGVAPLCALADHPEAGVRRAVVDGLLSQEDERAVAALIRLSADPDPEVRDWATFGLGTLSSLDTPAIRDALAARLDDPHGDAQEEGMFGLAMRHDPRAIPVLLDLLEEHEGPLLDSALIVLADHVDDPRLAAAIARRWPDGVPPEARGHAGRDRWLVSPDDPSNPGDPSPWNV